MTESREYRIDILRAVLIALVLLWHLQPIRIAPDEPATIFEQIPVLMLELFHQHVALLAVPTFFLVSLIIFCRKISQDQVYAAKRIKRLGKLFLFWAAVQSALFFFVKIMSKVSGQPLQVEETPFVKALIMGGPALPLIGDSVFYFLFNLLALTLGSCLWRRHIQKHALNVALIAAFMAYFTASAHLNIEIPYWRLDNFLIYIPMSAIICDYAIKPKWFVLSLLAFIGLSLLDISTEWLTASRHNVYARTSIVAGALFLYLSAFQVKPAGRSNLIAFLSRYSLGIFAIHKYLMLIVYLATVKVFAIYGIYPERAVAGVRLSILFFCTGFITILATLAAVRLMAKSIRLRSYLS